MLFNLLDETARYCFFVGMGMFKKISLPDTGVDVKMKSVMLLVMA